MSLVQIARFADNYEVCGELTLFNDVRKKPNFQTKNFIKLLRVYYNGVMDKLMCV